MIDERWINCQTAGGFGRPTALVSCAFLITVGPQPELTELTATTHRHNIAPIDSGRPRLFQNGFVRQFAHKPDRRVITVFVGARLGASVAARRAAVPGAPAPTRRARTLIRRAVGAPTGRPRAAPT